MIRIEILFAICQKVEDGILRMIRMEQHPITKQPELEEKEALLDDCGGSESSPAGPAPAGI